MKSAVCLLLPVFASRPLVSLDAARFLAVSRRHDTSRWGLPGGKVDPGEHNLQALLREVREEIGLALSPEELEPLYVEVVPGKGPQDTYWVTTYLWKRPVGPLSEAVTAEEGLSVTWRSHHELSDPRQTPFAAYNVGVFEAYRKWLAHQV